MTEGEMVAWHHRVNGHEFERTLGNSLGKTLGNRTGKPGVLQSMGSQSWA